MGEITACFYGDANDLVESDDVGGREEKSCSVLEQVRRDKSQSTGGGTGFRLEDGELILYQAGGSVVGAGATGWGGMVSAEDGDWQVW